MARKLAAGNWKMNGLGASLAEIEALVADHGGSSINILICPPSTLISRAASVAGAIAIGGQDCHANSSGAHTGDISAEMLTDAGASYVILGHSERRTDHGESDADVAAKARAAVAAGLTAIICVGETLAQREAGATLDVVGGQIAGSVPSEAPIEKLVIAYEPVWAIGTGKVPTLAEIGEVHGFIRAKLSQIGLSNAGAVPILYGGSVKPSNAAEIFAVADVDGALVGGASLKAADFSGIISALEAA